MGLLLALDLDTNLGNTTNAYLHIDSLHISSVNKSIIVGVTLWFSQEDYEKARQGNSFLPFGQISHQVVYYSEKSITILGDEIQIPAVYYIEIPKGWDYKDPYSLCYSHIKSELIKLFHSESILDCKENGSV